MQGSSNVHPTLEAEAKALTEAITRFAALDPFDVAIPSEYKRLSTWETDLAHRISAEREAGLSAYIRIIDVLPDAGDLFAKISSAYPEAEAIRRRLRGGGSGE